MTLILFIEVERNTQTLMDFHGLSLMENVIATLQGKMWPPCLVKDVKFVPGCRHNGEGLRKMLMMLYRWPMGWLCQAKVLQQQVLGYRFLVRKRGVIAVVAGYWNPDPLRNRETVRQWRRRWKRKVSGNCPEQISAAGWLQYWVKEFLLWIAQSRLLQ